MREGTPGAVWLRGRVFDGAGEPVPDALVESWQADPAGAFGGAFRGFGRSGTDEEGRWAILTLKPGPITPQAPHVDLAVFARGLLHRVVTRLYFADEEQANADRPGARRPGRAGPSDPRRPPRRWAATSSTSTSRGPMRRPSSRSDEQRHEEGMTVRREVLGDEHVDRAQARTTDFTADFQDFITRCAWGEVWTRPGLDRRMRSAITLAVLMTLRAEEEIAMHVRAALRNGLTADEIGEVLLHGAIYAGVPAANTAFAVAQRVIAETDGDG